jgi:hypothetical protein
MAARSPVTIESSPPYDVYLVPSITPDSLRRSRSTNSVTRSSSQLPSPSAFVHPRAQPLKNGSRAQRVPAGANAGFASAASILKGRANGEDVALEHGGGIEDVATGSNGQERGGKDSTEKSTGKLVKPKKAAKSGKASLLADAGPDSLGFDSFMELKQGASKLSAKATGPLHANISELPGNIMDSRRPNLNFSEFSFETDMAPAQLYAPISDETATKKAVRKRASKATSREPPATKKTRKSKAKSEAIILDSDEPEPSLIPDGVVETTEATVASEPVAKKPRQRKTKQPTVDETKKVTSVSTAEPVAEHDKVAAIPVKTSTEKSAYFVPKPPVIELEHLSSSPPPVILENTSQTVHQVAADETTTADLDADASLPPAEQAPRRRRSWTPMRDSFSVNTLDTLRVPNQGPDANLENVPFSELLGNFSYLNSETASIQRATSGEPGTKRRCIELSDQLAVHQPQTVDTSKPKAASKTSTAVKKPKAVPKKPQTVTAHALAAYQSPQDLDSVQSTVSTYFAPQKAPEQLPTADPSIHDPEVATKVKKPRKSRAKVPPVDGDIAPVKKVTKPRTKANKVKVKFDKNEYVAPLYSPTQACKQIKAQDFVFGTSSQLAADESADTVRDIQLAIQQSEMTGALPNSSQIGTQLDLSAIAEEKSCARVPTAPHGTCLSVEQAGRELWCVGARDNTGSRLAQRASFHLPIAFPTADEQPIVRAIDIISLPSFECEGNEHPGAEIEKLPDPPLELAPPSEYNCSDASVKAQLTLSTVPKMVEHTQLTTIGSENLPTGEDWVFLHSDDSVGISPISTSKLEERSHKLVTSPVRRTALQPLDANIPIGDLEIPKGSFNKLQVGSFSTTTAALDKDRSRIQPSIVNLDSSPVMVLSPKQGRGRPRKDSSPERLAQTSPTRGPGRPRKNSLIERTVETSHVRGRGQPCQDDPIGRAGSVSPKRPVGRPRKESTITRLASMSPDRSHSKERTTIRLTSASPKRPMGQPRKDEPILPVSSKRAAGRPRKGAANVRVSSVSPTQPVGKHSTVSVVGETTAKSPKRPVGRPRKEEATVILSSRAFHKAKSPLQPSASQPVSRKEWTNIDEISDSDSPPTPSPHRRLASSSPAFVRPLDFQLPLSPSAPKIAVTGNAAIKATDASWPAMQASIFPRIAKTIKAAPISEDVTMPSWHEKILLYDPIVLEDFTAWLNSQGLRTEIERLKHKTKTRGRKKKDAPPEVDEWETVRDELKPWMVQKWCEENSVCCLWKEGLRGGVKARY